jgi:hypothetical protein
MLINWLYCQYKHSWGEGGRGEREIEIETEEERETVGEPEKRKNVALCYSIM